MAESSLSSEGARRAPGVGLPPSPNWYISCLGSLGADGRLFAYAAHNLVVVTEVEAQRIACVLPGPPPPP